MTTDSSAWTSLLSRVRSGSEHSPSHLTDGELGKGWKKKLRIGHMLHCDCIVTVVWGDMWLMSLGTTRNDQGIAWSEQVLIKLMEIRAAYKAKSKNSYIFDHYRLVRPRHLENKDTQCKGHVLTKAFVGIFSVSIFCPCEITFYMPFKS